jgi:hypothetical protein
MSFRARGPRDATTAISTERGKGNRLTEVRKSQITNPPSVGGMRLEYAKREAASARELSVDDNQDRD